jgi:hypothetical protein
MICILGGDGTSSFASVENTSLLQKTRQNIRIGILLFSFKSVERTEIIVAK